MATGRPQSLVSTCDQWNRSTHDGTALDPATGDLMLSWTDPDPAMAAGRCPSARGRAIDRLCRVYLAREQRIDRVDLGPTDGIVDYHSQPDPVTVVGGSPDVETVEVDSGDFVSAPRAALADAAGLAIDGADRLFVGDRERATISVLDLWSRRLLRSITVATSSSPERHPVALATVGDEILALVDAPLGVLRLTASRGPVEVALPAEIADVPGPVTARAISAFGSGEPVLLVADPSGSSWLVTAGFEPHRVGAATDIVVDGDGAVVVAPCAADRRRIALHRWFPGSPTWQPAMPLDATGYDGDGVVLTASGRVAYMTEQGVRLAVAMPVTFRSTGSCTTYRLDSGQPRNNWGRVFVDACLPEGTEVVIGAATSDDEHAGAIDRVPAHPAVCAPIGDLAASPPLPPDKLRPDPSGRMHRRRDSSTPWWFPTDHYETLEAPIAAAPGRYLWVTVRLSGRNRRTPKVREIRVERTGHLLLRRLPAVFSVRPEEAGFLRRYLEPLDGMLHDLDVRSRCREILVDPRGTPTEALDWLASFVGLLLDERWAVAARRQLVAEIVELYRRRGTLSALGRYIEIYLAGDRAGADEDERVTDPWVRPVIVEHFRLRGIGGPLLGNDPAASSRSVLGAGFRVGGEVGELDERFLDPDDDAESSFRSHAHRFTVLIPRPLDAEEELAVRHVLDTERPAHTAYELCTVDAGMRVGRGTHVGLSSIVGPTGAFAASITDRIRLDRGTILGGQTTGIAAEAGRVGTGRIG